MADRKDPLDGLPDEVADLIKPHMPANVDQLNALSNMLAGKRKEAVAARSQSGIEQVWKECEEAYVGIDDANRHEMQDARWSKPWSMDGPVTTGRKPDPTDTKSTVFVRLTARYVDAGTAKLCEILLPADDKAFSVSDMPVPELIKAKDDTSQVVHDRLGNIPLTRPAKPGELPSFVGSAAPTVSAASPGPAMPTATGAAPAVQPALAAGAAAPVGPPQVPLTVKDLAEERIEIERKKAKAAETRIYDWMCESQYTAELRKVIFDASRCGVGVLKAPIPEMRRNMAVEKSGDGIEIIIKEKVAPCARWVDFWNIYPDPACGENIHNGDFVFERDYLAERQLRDLKDVPGYLPDQIDLAIQAGPEKNSAAGDNERPNPEQPRKEGRFEVWYFYGALKREEWDAINSTSTKPLDASGNGPVYAIVTMVHDKPIRAVINPLDSGTFPYHSFPWQRRTGHWAGIGVAEQMRTPQRIT
ncbi:MAG: hypothetical protein KGL39_46050, partial [Patescibacteria group bacterium]|nr:hypothetical protein [Patescibacteria group bacterium]